MNFDAVVDFVAAFSAWSPRFTTEGEWRIWAAHDDSALEAPLEPTSDFALPDVSFLPAALRRRLSVLTKISCYLLHEVTQKATLSAPPRIVMASRHGQSATMVELLDDIATNRQLSPASFTKSVHNSTVGLYSIATANTEHNVAVAAMEDTFHAGLCEATLQLCNDAETSPVVFLYADDTVPECFQAYVDEPISPFGCALALCRNSVSGIEEMKRAFHIGQQPLNGQPVTGSSTSALLFLRRLLESGAINAQVSTSPS